MRPAPPGLRPAGQRLITLYKAKGDRPIPAKTTSPGKGRAVRIQYGALPYRFTETGDLQVLVVTTRTTRRWIIPKGWPMKGLKPAQSAAREAYEETGVRGEISAKSIGTFRYDKQLDGGDSAIPCEVVVYPLLVKRQAKTWLEAKEREVLWLNRDEAAAIVGDDGLRFLIRSLVLKPKRQGRKMKFRQAQAVSAEPCG